MPSPAPYTRDTLAFMRVSARDSVGVHHMARLLGWTVHSVRRIADKHQIALREDDAADAKAIMSLGKIVRPDIKLERERPMTKRGIKSGKLPALTEPRIAPITVALTESGREKVKQLAAERELKVSGAVARVIDFLARRGELGTTLDLALSEEAA